MIHKVAVKDRKILAVTPRAFVQGSKNADTLMLLTDPEWLSMDSIVVRIDKLGQDPFSAIYTDDFKVPSRFLAETGPFSLGLIGYKDSDIRIATEDMHALDYPVVVDGTDDIAPTPEEEQPDLWAQLITICTETAKNEESRQEAEKQRQKDFDEAIDRCEEATKRAEQIASVQRGTGISTGEGLPSLGGIEGDLYIDYETGDLYEFEKTEG